MKRIVLLITLLIIGFSGYSQSKRPFVYGGFGATPKHEFSGSAEAGYWGIESSLSFSLTYDAMFAVDNTSNTTHWLGAKTYFTVLDNKELSLMIYTAPKFNVNSSKTFLLEYGVNPNYKIGKEYLIAVTLGNQVTKETQSSIFLSLGYIILL